MISIIICSRNEATLRNATHSITSTIGVAFEVVAIDNKRGNYSIFQAYNEGVKRSKYDILCFMHEDIVLKTENWGAVIQRLFTDNPAFGMLGIAGSSYKTQLPSHWSFPHSLNKTIYVNIIQHYRSQQVLHHLNNPRQELLSEVVAVDGVWFCVRREVFTKTHFDDATYNNFHCYDVDFSLSVKQYYKVGVTFEVLIEHLSEGSFNQTWLRETIKLHEKWQAVLPLNTAQLTKREQYLEEKGAFVDFAIKMMANKTYPSAVWRLLWSDQMKARFGALRLAVIAQAAGKELLKRRLASLRNGRKG